MRKRVNEIEKISRALHRCPKCDMDAVARKGTGIWECRKCGYKFAGGAYQPTTPTLKVAQRAIDRTAEEIRKYTDTSMASTYKCARCKQKVEIDVNVRCPYCGHRILFKERGAAIKELKAR